MQSPRRLQVYHKAHALNLDVQVLADSLHARGFVKVAGQLARSGAAIAENIVEGAGAATDREYAQRLGYSIREADECEYELIEARDKGFVPATVTDPLIERTIEVRKMTIGLWKTVSARDEKRPRRRSRSKKRPS